MARTSSSLGGSLFLSFRKGEGSEEALVGRDIRPLYIYYHIISYYCHYNHIGYPYS